MSSWARSTCSAAAPRCAPRSRRAARIDDPVRAAGHRQDDAGAHAGGQRPRGLRGGVGGAAPAAPRCARCSSERRTGASTNNERTIFFLDEIHRFNKAQQDTLLPAVEEGLVVLVGATTENPYFEVNSALLSRCRVYELRALDEGARARAAAPGAQPRARHRRPAHGEGRGARVPGPPCRRRRAQRPVGARPRRRDRGAPAAP